MPLPDNFSTPAYVARWDNPAREDDDAEWRWLHKTLNKHYVPLLVALQSAEFSNPSLNALCHDLAAHLDQQIAAIKLWEGV